ncbi:MAG: FAD-binding protein, partial [Deltaproteobacteria bacterium]|nr:FAD-binding protein [Deltaproteobacteria bacterium]
LVICLARLNRILDIHPKRRCAVVQPGVTNFELQNALAPKGFFFAPDPASQKVATLGGNIAENSGGPHCFKYGVTRNHVLGLQVVLADGEIVRLGGSTHDYTENDLCGFIIGGEGTLGIITEATVKILPLPEAVITMLAIYDNVTEAAQSVSKIIEGGIIPATLEMMDAPLIRAVEESYPSGYPLDASAVLIIEIDGPKTGLAGQAEQIKRICSENGCRHVREARDEAERDLLWAGRRGAFGAAARLAPNFLVMDCTVPRTMLPEALSRVAAVAKKHQLTHGNVFHAGDGNLHPLLLFDARGHDQLNLAHQAGFDIVKECVALGGTITGEHGVGAEKIEAMRLIFSEDDLDVQRSLKQVFDPLDLLNPGKIIPAPIERDTPPEPPITEKQNEYSLTPSDTREACEMVRRAFLNRTPLLPQGHGTQGGFGNLPTRPVIPLRSLKFSDVIDYDPANQVVTIGSGMRLSVLQKNLADQNQWLPIRPLMREDYTIGGLVGLDVCGPEGLRYGAPRDLLLGLKFISGEGRLISTGGKVIKNVAGYEVSRLLAGSAGTLGFLAELTFRLLPLPETGRAVCAFAPLENIAAAASELLCSNIEPAFITAFPVENQAKENEHGENKISWRLAVGFEGFTEQVKSQEERCVSLLLKNEIKEPASQNYDIHKGISNGRCGLFEDSEFLLLACLPLDRITEFIAGATSLVQTKHMLADFGRGRFAASITELPNDTWERLCRLAEALGGHMRLERAPYEFKRRNDVFGLPRPARKLMHAVKKVLDPHDIFVPGSLPGSRWQKSNYKQPGKTA